jgi:hypothetical protein
MTLKTEIPLPPNLQKEFAGAAARETLTDLKKTAGVL